MATTPINGWPVPSDTDFVINGAAAIRDFADAVDEEALVNNGDQTITAGSLTIDSAGTTARTLDVIREVSAANTTARLVVATHGNGSAMLQRLRGADDEVSLRLEGTGQAGVIKGATHRPLPFAIEAQTVATANVAANGLRTITVTFTAGRFTSAPSVQVTATGVADRLASQTISIHPTTSGFTVQIFNQSSAVNALGCCWNAVQVAA